MTAPEKLAPAFTFDFARVYGVLGRDRVPGRGGLAIAPRGWLTPPHRILDLADGHLVSPHDVLAVDNPMWKRQGIGVASYRRSTPAGAANPGLLGEFRAELADEQRRLLSSALSWCQEFLSGRRAGAQRLSSHPVVSQAVARLVCDAVTLTTADLTATLATTPGRGWFVDEVDTMANELIRLAGGRAMLSGQMVHLRMLLLTLNRAYMEE